MLNLGKHRWIYLVLPLEMVVNEAMNMHIDVGRGYSIERRFGARPPSRWYESSHLLWPKSLQISYLFREGRIFKRKSATPNTNLDNRIIILFRESNARWLLLSELNQLTADREQHTLDEGPKLWNVIGFEILAKVPSFGSILKLNEGDVVVRRNALESCLSYGNERTFSRMMPLFEPFVAVENFFSLTTKGDEICLKRRGITQLQMSAWARKLEATWANEGEKCSYTCNH